MILGLLLAGGDSSRMGRDKARLLVGGEEAWLHLGRKMLEAGCTRVHMGINPALQDPLTPLVPKDINLRLHVIPQAQRERGPIGSLAHLLSLIQEPYEACLVAPVDHPYVTVETLRRLLESKGPIRIPTHEGRRGHPIVLEAKPAAMVLHLKGTLKTLTRDPDLEAIEIEVPDETVHWNLDRPEDYERFEG